MNVLFLSHRLPYAPNRGDRVRAFHLLREISRWATVDVASLVHDADEAAHVADLSSVARRVAVSRVPRMRNLATAAIALPTSIPTTHSLLNAPGFGPMVDSLVADGKPDVIVSFCTGVAPLVFRPALSNIPVVLDMVDVDSEKWAALASTSRAPRSWIYAREARVLRSFEARAVRRSVATLVVNHRERQLLQQQLPDSRILVVENGVDLESLRPRNPPAGEPVVVFCGVMNYEPNVEGVLWLANDVWPRVLARMPEARLRIVGADPASSVQALDDPSKRIEVTGSVPDVRPYLWSAAVSVAPLKTSRGVQNKVLEAVAAGLPSVVTPAVMGGLPAAISAACLMADSVDDFALSITRLLDQPAERRRSTAQMADLESLSWDRQLSSLNGILAGATGDHGASRDETKSL